MTPPPNPASVEICVDDPAGVRAAADGGAHRIELCADLGCGGVTPSLGMLDVARASTDAPIVVLVRPRPGPFVYEDSELRAMIADVRSAFAHGAAAVAVGCIDDRGALQRDHMRALVDAAEGRPVTCHRAFDHCADPLAALDTLIELGVSRVLTSGQAASAAQGTALLRTLVQRAQGRLVVLPAAGIRSDNARDLIAATGCSEVHASASAWRSRSPGAVAVGTADSTERVRYTDVNEVRALVRAVTAS